jgi:hypothetical protein
MRQGPREDRGCAWGIEEHEGGAEKNHVNTIRNTKQRVAYGSILNCDAGAIEIGRPPDPDRRAEAVEYSQWLSGPMAEAGSANRKYGARRYGPRPQPTTTAISAMTEPGCLGRRVDRTNTTCRRSGPRAKGPRSKNRSGRHPISGDGFCSRLSFNESYPCS